MQIRIATKDDLETVLALSVMFHQESPYKDSTVDSTKCLSIIEGMLSNPKDQSIIFLLEDGNDAVGILAAHVSEILFSHDKIAVEQMWWVKKDYRTLKSLKLLDAFEYWAEKVADVSYIQLCTVGDIKVEKLKRLYKRRGFDLFERVFLKCLH